MTSNQEKVNLKVLCLVEAIRMLLSCVLTLLKVYYKMDFVTFLFKNFTDVDFFHRYFQLLPSTVLLIKLHFDSLNHKVGQATKT